MNTRETLKINNLGHVEISGCDTVELAKQYGTPLYVMDFDHILNMVNTFTNTIKEYYGNGRMFFASKAFCVKGIYSLLKNTDAGCDVVSGGELYTALQGGMSPDKIVMHGNNKLPYEIEMAIDNKISTIVCDGIDDIELVNSIAKEKNVIVDVLLRVNPGVDAHTHEFITTAKPDSKFGLSIYNGTAKAGIKAIIDASNLNFYGIHCHIGSQIFEYAPFQEASKIMVGFLKELKDDFDVEATELNMGGGFGIYYEGEDRAFTLETYAEHLKATVATVASEIEKVGLNKPFLAVEPGRSIVGEAGITLYTVGNIKEIPDIRKYVSIDGGMFDNPRYALYQSRYSAVIANKATEKADDLITICGKCCESGDMIAKDVYTQKAERGDIMCVFSTGAYNYSMASNYNRNFVPAVVAVKGGQSDYLVKPQTYEDIVRNDVVPSFMKD